MSMTRKDFVAIAAALKNAQPSAHDPNVAHIQHRIDCREVAGVLAGTNPRFDRDRFLAACGVRS